MAHTLIALGGAFLAAFVFGRLGRRLGLPTIPLFMLAGVLLGPNTPGLELVSHPEEFELIAVIGLVLLLFYLGLEFSLGDLIGGGTRLLGSGALYIALNVGGGLLLGLALGWGGAEALVVAGVVGISSSAIVTKLLVELKRLANPETKLILGVIVVEDVFLALYLAALQPLLSDTSGWAALWSFSKAFLFLLALTAFARWGGGLVGRLLGSSDDELLTVAFLGLALLTAGAAEEAGVSEAIGAFMIGMVIAESPVAERVERLVLPLRDAFAAIFFFTFGLTVDPGDVASVAGPVLAAVALTLVLAVVAGYSVGRVNDLPPRGAANLALTLVSRGEFALILVALAIPAGLDARLAPFAAGYVLVLALGGPLLAANPRWLATAYRRMLPV
ncbi:MAG: cation:proton antiporter [Acidimicrobiales bacterium]